MGHGSNGSAPGPADKDLMTLELRRQVRDIHGNKVDRFREDQASWTLGLHVVEAVETGLVPRALSEIEQSVLGKGPAPMQRVQRRVPVYELHWRIVQERGERAIQITVPYAEAYVRTPIEIVEFRGVVQVPMPDGRTQTLGDADDSKVTREAMPATAAALVRAELQRRATLVRGEAAEH